MTYSLYAQNTASRLGVAGGDPLDNTVKLMIPLSEEQAVMRTNLASSMLPATLAFNV